MAIPGTSGPAALNGALEALVRPLALELRPTRVPAERRDAIFAQVATSSPVGRVGHPDDVAHAIRFVVENDFVTGAVIECHRGPRIG
jgi:NAD(P)-dependent dehydrogenase (short-subunit alcohol dehydrogenase family)